MHEAYSTALEYADYHMKYVRANVMTDKEVEDAFWEYTDVDAGLDDVETLAELWAEDEALGDPMYQDVFPVNRYPNATYLIKTNARVKMFNLMKQWFDGRVYV